MLRTMETCQKGHRIYNESCTSCIQLKKTWYAELRHTGFIDIEAGGPRSEAFDLGCRRDFADPKCFENKINYFQWAKEKLTTTKFESQKDEMIWEYHCNGLSTPVISPLVSLEESWVRRKIKRIKEYLEDAPMSLGSMSYSAACY